MSNALKTDLALTRRSFGIESSNREAVDFQLNRGDLDLVTGPGNLAQAILNRLYTRRGELAGLGHPNYGSRLTELIGEPITWRTKAKAELYIREALAYEKRVKDVVEISFPPVPDRNTLALVIILEPVEGGRIQVSLDLNLEG